MIAKVLLAGAIAIPAAATATVAATGVAWLDVQQGGRDGHRIVLPVPLMLAEAAASLVPERELDLELGEAAAHLRSAGAVLRALRDAPDGEYVRVVEEDEQVVIEKRGDILHLEVHGRSEEVKVSVPLAALSEIISEDGRLSPARAVRRLRHSRSSTLVDVRDGDDHVKISIF